MTQAFMLMTYLNGQWDGKVAVHGEYWDGRSIGGAIPAGSRVRVVTVYDRRIDVVAAGDGEEGSA